MVSEILLLCAGFILLIKGADFLIDGASSLAVRLSVSEIMVGLTIVAFGTSAPELVVNILASIHQNSGIVLGNIIGSNIANILLILGVSGLIGTLKTEKNTVWREIPFSLLAAVVLLVMSNDTFFDASANVISKGEGTILLLFFVIFLAYTFAIPKVDIRDQPEIKKLSKYKILTLILTGLLGLFLGGRLVVEQAVLLAQKLGLSEKVIALTIISIGTSLPELFTSAVAAKKGKYDLAIGNVVGSNIFNIFLILGVSASISPVSINTPINSDLFVLVLTSILLFLTMFTGNRRILDKWEAALLFFFYVGYILFLLIAA
jgi:cation:H+ antiporter